MPYTIVQSVSYEVGHIMTDLRLLDREMEIFEFLRKYLKIQVTLENYGVLIKLLVRNPLTQMTEVIDKQIVSSQQIDNVIHTVGT